MVGGALAGLPRAVLGKLLRVGRGGGLGVPTWRSSRQAAERAGGGGGRPGGGCRGAWGGPPWILWVSTSLNEQVIEIQC